MKNKIGPNDLLAIGTPVQVWDKRGTVASASFIPESTGKGMICLHEVILTEQFGRVAGSNIKSWRAIKKPKRVSVNYSAIRVA